MVRFQPSILKSLKLMIYFIFKACKGFQTQNVYNTARNIFSKENSTIKIPLMSSYRSYSSFSEGVSYRFLTAFITKSLAANNVLWYDPDYWDSHK